MKNFDKNKTIDIDASSDMEFCLSYARYYIAAQKLIKKQPVTLHIQDSEYLNLSVCFDQAGYYLLGVGGALPRSAGFLDPVSLVLENTKNDGKDLLHYSYYNIPEKYAEEYNYSKNVDILAPEGIEITLDNIREQLRLVQEGLSKLKELSNDDSTSRTRDDARYDYVDTMRKSLPCLYVVFCEAVRFDNIFRKIWSTIYLRKTEKSPPYFITGADAKMIRSWKGGKNTTLDDDVAGAAVAETPAGAADFEDAASADDAEAGISCGM